MRFGGRHARVGVLLVAATVVALGCREGSAPVPYNHNLGDEDTLLLPGRSVSLDVGLKGGGADWVDFPEYRAEAMADNTEQPGEAAGEVEAEVHGLINDYNAVLAERTLDDLLQYHIADQQDVFKELYQIGFAVRDELAQAKEAFEKGLPDSADRIATVFAVLEIAAGARLTVESLRVVNDGEVDGRLPAGSVTPTCRFVVIDDEWFLEFPQLPAVEELKSRLDALSSACAQWRQDLQSAERPAEEILDGAEAFVAALSGDVEDAAADPEDE